MEREGESSFSGGGTLREEYCYGMLELEYFLLFLFIFLNLIFIFFFLDDEETCNYSHMMYHMM